VDAAIEKGAEIAFGRRHLAIRFEHVLRVLIEEQWFQRALHAVGGDLNACRSRVDTWLDDYADVGRRAEILPTKALERVIRRTKAHAETLRQPASSDLLVVFALQEAEHRQVFVELEVPYFELITTVVHGVGPRLEDDGDDDAHDVVFHNDDITTLDFVIAVLQETLGLDGELARKATFEIHKNGEGTVATFPKLEARERVRTAMQRAREAGFPLRVTLRRRAPAGPVPPPDGRSEP
jgi:ATP-dependent Clp protease adaptor protein ClpS